MEGVKLYRPSAPTTTQTRSSSANGISQLTRSLSRGPRTAEAPVVDDSQPISLSSNPQTLGEELTAAQRNFPRITFEQIAVQSRTCSVGLYGPWAARGGIAFLRIMFSFPKFYPELMPPTIEIERSPDVSARTRAFLLKSARELMHDHVHHRKPAAFESCLKFLLGDRSAALEAAKVDRFVDSDEEMREPTPGMRPDVLQNNVSVPSPRQAGACFTAEGRLIIFYCGDFRTVQSPKIEMAFPKRNYKFEAFGSLAVTPISHKNRAGGTGPGLDEESSESDEALKLPMSRRIRMRSDLVSAAPGPLPAREISTFVTIRSLAMLRPLPTPNLDTHDPMTVIDSLLNLTLNVDPIRYRTWVLVRLFILSSREPHPCQPENAAVFLEILKYLRGIHDLETLGYIACVIEMNRRACGSRRRRLGRCGDHGGTATTADEERAGTTTDYFNSKGVLSGQRTALKPTGSQGLGVLQTPELPVAVEASQSPSKGSWSTFFLSLTQGATLSNPAPGPAANRASNSSTGLTFCSTTTPSPDRAVAMLKQQLAGSSNPPPHHHFSSSVEGSGIPPKRVDPPKSSRLDNDGANKNAKWPHTFPVKPGPNTPRKRQLIIVKKLSPEKEENNSHEDALETRRGMTIEDDEDPVLQAQLEGYKYYLCDLLLRRGKFIERAVVVKLLRVPPSEGTSISNHSTFSERARLASGLERSRERGLELVLLCPTCGTAMASPDSHSTLTAASTSDNAGPVRGSCMTCNGGGRGSMCVICHRPVAGLARDCVRCLHGGHLVCMAWWWTDAGGRWCPTGCGCLCSVASPHHEQGPHLGGHPCPPTDSAPLSRSSTHLAPTTTTAITASTSSACTFFADQFLLP